MSNSGPTGNSTSSRRWRLRPTSGIPAVSPRRIRAFRGRYSDGVAWSTDYTFELSDNGDTLTMTSATEGAEVSVYTRTPIPEEVLDAPQVRSGTLPDGFRRIL